MMAHPSAGTSHSHPPHRLPPAVQSPLLVLHSKLYPIPTQKTTVFAQPQCPLTICSEPPQSRTPDLEGTATFPVNLNLCLCMTLTGLPSLLQEKLQVSQWLERESEASCACCSACRRQPTPPRRVPDHIHHDLSLGEVPWPSREGW